MLQWVLNWSSGRLLGLIAVVPDCSSGRVLGLVVVVSN